MQSFELQRDDYDEVCSNGTSETVDVAFRKISKTSAAFQIWRIENMNIVAVPRDQYGVFYETDSYIIYAASPYGQSCDINVVSREVKGGLVEHHIHFWLGSQTTPEKSGVAAYKAVELDNFLNSCCTQHRETEGHETSRFLCYFKNGIRILKPDLIENIDSSNKKKLYRVKGKRIPIIKEMPNISWDYFASSGIYIILIPKTIFIWMGRSSSMTEKLKATEISHSMKEENEIPNLIYLDDGYEKTLSEDKLKEFNKYLPLEKRMVVPEMQNEDENGNFHESIIKLYKCSENNGKYRVVEIKNGPLQQNDLNSDDVFIIDQYLKGVWAWVGRKSNDKERNEALRNARGFVKKKKYPNYTKVARVVEGYEPSEFKVLFFTWKEDIRGSKPSVLLSRYDAIQMEERPVLASETQLIDDGTGTLKIWRINHNDMVEIPKERHGIFFSGDCYIALYSYQIFSEQKHLLYCWLGSNASQEEVNTATINVDKLDDELGQIGFQARIIEGRETPHFLQLFKGKLTVFKGKGIDYDESGRNLKNPTQYLVQVFGSTHYSSKAFQVSVKPSVFNSNYCFVLKRLKKAYVWCGTYSTGDQREMAKAFAGKDFDIVLEGKEKDDFLSLLGDKTPHSSKMIKNESDPKITRLFQCSMVNGNFSAEEIMFFTQLDLIPEDIMLLDTHFALYVWIGKMCNNEYQRLSIKMALNYLQEDPSGRDMNTTVIHVRQEKEPSTFIGYFPSWDKNFWKSYKSFSKVRQEIELNHSNTNGIEMNGFSDIHKTHSDFDQFEKYPISILKEPNDKLPSRINPLNKEVHLTHDDFVYLFKMAYTEFEKLPRWKQQEMKKKVGLF